MHAHMATVRGLIAGAAFVLVAVLPSPSRRTAVRIDPRSIPLADLAELATLMDDVWSDAPTFDGVVRSEKLPELVLHAGHVDVLVEDVERAAREERARLADRYDKDWFAEYRDGEELS